jgi:hypothetical protein
MTAAFSILFCVVTVVTAFWADATNPYVVALVFLLGRVCYAIEIEWHRSRTFAKLTAERTYYRDMWLAQRVENENFRKQLGLVPVSDEAERELLSQPLHGTDRDA